MRKDAKEEAEELFNSLLNVNDPLHKYPMCFDTAKQCAIIAQQRVLELDVWNCYNIEELNYQREILKEIEKL